MNKETKGQEDYDGCPFCQSELSSASQSTWGLSPEGWRAMEVAHNENHK